MVGDLVGYLSAFLGLTVLILPLLFRELSRPRDSIWGALIIIMGLIQITASDRLTGSLAFAQILQALIVGRMAVGLIHHRWQVLSEKEKSSLKTIGRFNMSMRQSFFASINIASALLELIRNLRPKAKSTKKKWIRSGSPKEENSLKDEELDSNDTKKLQGSNSPDRISSPKDENITPEDS